METIRVVCRKFGEENILNHKGGSLCDRNIVFNWYAISVYDKIQIGVLYYP